MALAVICGFGAAFAFIAYVANGMVAGDLIGLPGREHDIAVAQHRSSLGLLSCIFLQLITAAALFSYLDREDGDRVGYIIGAAFASLVLSLACAIALFLAARAFR